MEQPLVLALGALAVFTLASAGQAVTGFGLALISVPLLALLADPVSAVVAATAVGVVFTSFAAYTEREHLDTAVAGRFIGAGLLGLPLGLAALRLLSADQLTLLMAAVLATLVALMAAQVRLPGGRGPQLGAGVVSGALLTSTGMNGPPLVVVLHAARMAPQPFRATLQAVFSIQGLVALGAFTATGAVSATAALLAGAGVLGIPLGWVVGERCFRALSPETFRRVVLALLAATAVVAAVTALT